MTKIPDTPASFIMKWEGIQQDTALNLMETLRNYWKERVNKLQELETTKEQIKIETSPTEWKKNTRQIRKFSRDTNLELKRKKTTQKQEIGAQGTLAPKRPTILVGSRGIPHATSSTLAPMS